MNINDESYRARVIVRTYLPSIYCFKRLRINKIYTSNDRVNVRNVTERCFAIIIIIIIVIV